MIPKIQYQQQRNKGREYKVADIIFAAKDLPIEKVDIRLLDKWYNLGLDEQDVTLVDVARKIKHVLSVDFKHPIIISDDGAVLDGKHRLTKALYLGKKTVNVKILPIELMPPAID